MAEIVHEAVRAALDAGADYADARLRRTSREDLALRNGRPSEVSAPDDAGLGLRVLVDGTWGFAAAPGDASALRRSGVHKSPRPKPSPRPSSHSAEPEESLPGRIESMGPGKNVLVPSNFVREDTGTHETLKILDDSTDASHDEGGFDPYNTGGFDRSRNWDKRFGK